MKIIPHEFAASIESREGDAGRDWLERIPGTVDDLCGRWGLEIDGAAMAGHLAIVIPVRREAEACVLKLSWQDADTRNDPLALKLWNGRGMVRLLESNARSGAMLLERLDASRTLFDLPLDETIPILGEMIRRLAVTGDAS